MDQDLLEYLAPPESGLAMVELPSPWTDSDKYISRIGPIDPQETALVRRYINLGDHSSDIRLDFGVPFRPHSWPRASLQSRCWTWRVSQSYQFKLRSHINELELRAI